jgi:hypothetical protein
MTDIFFIEKFIAEFSFSIPFVLFCYGISTPRHDRSVFLGFIRLLVVFPLYVKWLDFGPLGNIAVFLGLLPSAIQRLIILIRFKSTQLAIDEYQRKPRKPKFGLNDSLTRLNNFITVGLFASITTVIPIILYGETILLGVTFILIILVIWGKYSMTGYMKPTTKISPETVKVSLTTLLNLTLVFTITLIIVIPLSIKNFLVGLPLYIIYPIILPLIIFLPVYVSEYLLNEGRLAYFRNPEIAKVFISNISQYFIISMLITVILSDVITARVVLEKEDIEGMVLWINGLIFFLTYESIAFFKRNNLLKLESKITTLDELKSNRVI